MTASIFCSSGKIDFFLFLKKNSKISFFVCFMSFISRILTRQLLAHIDLQIIRNIVLRILSGILRAYKHFVKNHE